MHFLAIIVALILVGLFWRVLARVVGVLVLVGAGLGAVALLVTASQHQAAPVRTVAAVPAHCYAPPSTDPDPDVRVGMDILNRTGCPPH